MTNDPSVTFNGWYRSVGQKTIPIPPSFLNVGKTSKYTSIIGIAKYDGLKELRQKICCSELLKRRKEVYSSIKSCIAQNEKKSCV
jgi:hypothetical protein